LFLVYEEYLRQTYSWENLGFWKAVQEYEKHPSADKAKDIFDEFLEYGSIHECGDFERYHRESVRGQLHTGQPDVFEFLALFAVNSLIASSVREFFVHSLYKEYQSTCKKAHQFSFKRNKCSSLLQRFFRARKLSL